MPNHLQDADPAHARTPRRRLRLALPVLALAWLVVTLAWAGLRALEGWTLEPVVLIAGLWATAGGLLAFGWWRERELADSRDAYRDLAENARDHIWTCDLQGRLTYVNAATAAFFGVPVSALIGRSYATMVTDNPRNPRRRDVIASLAAGNTLAPLLIEVAPHPGATHRVWQETILSEVRDAEGRLIGVRGTSRDVTERVVAEERLRESEAKFRNFTESMSVVVFIYQDARFRYVNEMACAVSGYTREELLAMDLATLMPSPNRAAAEALAQAMAGGLDRWTSIERLMVRKDGRPVYVAWSGVVITYEGAPAVLGTGINVTEQRQAQQALARSEGRFRRLFESNIVGVMFAQTAGAITLANDAFLAIVGYSRSEMSTLSWRDLTPADHLDRDLRALHELGRTGTAEPYEKDFRHRDGHRVPVLLAAARLEEQPDTAACVVVNLTQLKRAEDALRTSEQRYRGLVESQRELVLRTAPDGRLTFVNDAYCATFGRTREALLGTSWTPLCHPDDLQRTQDVLVTLAHPPYRATFENRVLAADGVRWIEWETGAVFADGTLVEIQGAGRDVTIRREAQEALGRTVRALRTSEDTLRRLAHQQALIREEERKRVGFDLHDDVCQELVGVGILIESARRRMGADTPGYEELARGVRYVNEVVEHLRKLAGELRPMQLQDLGLAGSLRALAEGMSSPTTTVATVLPAEVPRLDEDTEVAVYRIAQEAVANALRHGAPAHVSIALAATADYIELEVRDDGCGFDPNAARAAAVGLVSMEERALALGGLLEVDSAPGSGASIRLHCPLRERTPSNAA